MKKKKSCLYAIFCKFIYFYINLIFTFQRHDRFDLDRKQKIAAAAVAYKYQLNGSFNPFKIFWRACKLHNGYLNLCLSLRCVMVLNFYFKSKLFLSCTCAMRVRPVTISVLHRYDFFRENIIYPSHLRARFVFNVYIIIRKTVACIK